MKIHILVEGQTEETFVRDTLRRHLEPRGIYLNPILATTKRVQGSANFRGGITSYSKVKYDLQRLLQDSSANLVTTFIDYYHLPTDFPAYGTLPAGTCYQRVDHLERAFKTDIQHPKFLPYLALHEFEAMLFADFAAIDRSFPERRALERLQAIKAAFSSPEEIDEEEPPSKRLLALFAGYQKTFHSPLIVEEIGLESIRRECRHFADWLTQIESLAGDAPE